MEIDLQLFVQRVAVIAIFAGFLGGCVLFSFMAQSLQFVIGFGFVPV